MNNSDHTPKPDHWTDAQERAYQVLSEQAGERMTSARRQTPSPPPPPPSTASPDGKWLWDGQRWVVAPNKGVSTRALIGIIVAASLIVIVVWTVVSENNRQDEVQRDFERLNCQQYDFC